MKEGKRRRKKTRRDFDVYFVTWDVQDDRENSFSKTSIESLVYNKRSKTLCFKYPNPLEVKYIERNEKILSKFMMELMTTRWRRKKFLYIDWLIDWLTKQMSVSRERMTAFWCNENMKNDPMFVWRKNK